MKHSVNVTLKKSYGGFDLTITLQSERMVDHEKGLPEFENLIENARAYFESFEKEDLPHMSAMASTAPPKITDTLPAIEICVKMEKGKKLYFVTTPQFQEHGVAFYDEHMKACGVDPAKIPDTGYKFKEGTKAVIEMVNGKPKRVLSLVKATT